MDVLHDRLVRQVRVVRHAFLLERRVTLTRAAPPRTAIRDRTHQTARTIETDTGLGILREPFRRSSPCSYSPEECVEDAFSEVRIAPVLCRVAFLCTNREASSPLVHKN